jgi:hypothetical protein
MKHVERDSSGNEKVYHRKKMLINPPFQLSFLKYVLGIAGFTLVTFYAVKVFFFYQTREYITSMGIPPEHMIFDFLAQQSRVMDWIFLGAAVVETFFLGFLGLRLSHRVAGPVYRVTQDMQSFARGEPARHIRFRKGDYFPELADAYNQQLDAHIKRKQDSAA